VKWSVSTVIPVLYSKTRQILLECKNRFLVDSLHYSAEVINIAAYNLVNCHMNSVDISKVNKTTSLQTSYTLTHMKDVNRWCVVYYIKS